MDDKTPQTGIASFFHIPWNRPYNRGKLLMWIHGFVQANAVGAFTAYKNFTDCPCARTCAGTRLPNCTWLPIWTWFSMILFIMFLVDWERPWCRTGIGKVCLYVNLPVSSTLFVLGLAKLLPKGLQIWIERDYLIWWQGLTLCLVSPLALWWEHQDGLQAAGLPLAKKGIQDEKLIDVKDEKRTHVEDQDQTNFEEAPLAEAIVGERLV